MIVLDSSVAIDLLLDLPPHAEVIRRRIRAEAPALAAPHLLDVEVAQVLRRHVRTRGISQARAREALADLLALPLTRYPHGPLLERALDLRGNVTAYDGVFLALAEALGAPLFTRDRGLARVPGCRAAVEVLG